MDVNLAAGSLLKARKIDALSLDDQAKNMARLVYLLLTISTYVAVRPGSFALALGLTEAQAKKVLIGLVNSRVVKFSESWGPQSQVTAWIFGASLRVHPQEIEKLAQDREAMDLEFTALLGKMPYPFLTVDLYKRTRSRAKVASSQGQMSGKLDGLIFRVHDWARANSKSIKQVALPGSILLQEAK